MPPPAPPLQLPEPALRSNSSRLLFEVREPPGTGASAQMLLGMAPMLAQLTLLLNSPGWYSDGNSPQTSLPKLSNLDMREVYRRTVVQVGAAGAGAGTAVAV